MNSLRLARSVRQASAISNNSRRSLATAASPSTSTSPSPSVIPLSNVEAQWKYLSKDEQAEVYKQLEDLQKKDWRSLSIDEKKAAYYVAFGPHGPRAPVNPPGTTLNVILATGAAIGAAGILFYASRAFAPPPPKTMTKEWQEATNEKALEEKQNPLTGISSAGYSGKGHVH